jgi:hypothetical protein
MTSWPWARTGIIESVVMAAVKALNLGDAGEMTLCGMRVVPGLIGKMN